MFWPTIWTHSSFRGQNKSVNTTTSALRAIQGLYEYLDAAQINLEQRLKDGWLLSLSEMDGLIRYLVLAKAKPERKSNVINLRRRTLAKEGSRYISPNTHAIRINYVREYLAYRSLEARAKLPDSNSLKASLESSSKDMVEYLKAAAPKKNSYQPEEKLGLRPKELSELKSLVDAKSDLNPWKFPGVKYRNQLMIQFLVETGVRCGELLNIKIEDINWHQETVKVLRRANDAGDMRKYQPLVKTMGREIPISFDLCEKLKVYIYSFRNQEPLAKKHGYLFVAAKGGRPLSLKSVNKMFDKIREASESLPVTLHPHILRHTFNDIFSQLMDEKGIDPVLEEKIRLELNGWKQGSQMPAHYSKRRIKEKAKEILKQKQEEEIKKNDI